MPGVIVAWMDDGELDGVFAESLLALVTVGTLNRVVTGWFRYETGPVLDLARNQVTEQFLRTEGDWLLFVDSDMIFTPDLVDRLLAVADPVERPVVVPVCYGMVKKYGVFPTVFRHIDGQFAIWFDHPTDQPFQVDACGAGCLLIHRSVFERTRGMVGRWWDHLLIAGDKPLGEDLAFCVRLGMAGIPIFADPSLDVKHLKVKIALDRKVFDEWRKDSRLATVMEAADGLHS